MCGRYVAVHKTDTLSTVFKVKPNFDSANREIIPGLGAPIINQENPTEVVIKRFGFDNIINARSESVTNKFNEEVNGHRILIPTSAFIEGKDYLFYNRYGPFALAGICRGDGFAILTTEPNKLIKRVHHRAPAILDTAEKREQWLYGNTHEAMQIIRPYEDTYKLAAFRVNAKNILKPVDYIEPQKKDLIKYAS